MPQSQFRSDTLLTEQHATGASAVACDVALAPASYCYAREQSVPAHCLIAPPHTHRGEEEVTHVLAGQLTSLIGNQLVHASRGAVVVKRKDVPHAMWNATGQPAQVLNVVAPFECGRHIDLLAALGDLESPILDALATRLSPLGVELHEDLSSTLLQRYGLRLGGQ